MEPDDSGEDVESRSGGLGDLRSRKKTKGRRSGRPFAGREEAGGLRWCPDS